MDTPIRTLKQSEFPPLLKEIPEPPRTLFAQGQLPSPKLKLLAVVGSREYTTYGQQVIDFLIPKLAPYPVGIVSGLARGVDTLAHKAALKHGLYTIAVPGSGLDPSVLYPARNRDLAEQIVSAGGGLLSEFTNDTVAAPWTFPKRNRIMAGMTHATLLVEAGAKSGTLITARLAADYNRELLAVPGNIFSPTSYGVHQFLKLGATMVTSAEDILQALGLDSVEPAKMATARLFGPEAEVIALLREPLPRDELIRALKLPVTEANILLMQMEMQGYIRYDSPHYSALVQ